MLNSNMVDIGERLDRLERGQQVLMAAIAKEFAAIQEHAPETATAAAAMAMTYMEDK